MYQKRFSVRRHARRLRDRYGARGNLDHGISDPALDACRFPWGYLAYLATDKIRTLRWGGIVVRTFINIIHWSVQSSKMSTIAI